MLTIVKTAVKSSFMTKKLQIRNYKELRLQLFQQDDVTSFYAPTHTLLSNQLNSVYRSSTTMTTSIVEDDLSTFFSDPNLLKILRKSKSEQHGYPISILSKLVWSQAKIPSRLINLVCAQVTSQNPVCV